MDQPSPTFLALQAARAASDAAEQAHWDAEHNAATRSELAQLAAAADAAQEAVYVASVAHRAAREAWRAAERIAVAACPRSSTHHHLMTTRGRIKLCVSCGINARQVATGGWGRWSSKTGWLPLAWEGETPADELADRAQREAQTMARVTGSSGCTVRYEHRAPDGTIVVDAEATWARA